MLNLGNPSTATEIFVNEKHLKENQQHQKFIFQDVERQLFTIALALLNKVSNLPQGITADSFNVEYISTLAMVKQLSAEDALKAYQAKVIDHVEAIRNLYPTLNRHEAEQFLIEMEQTTKRVAQATGQVQQMPGDTEEVKEDINTQTVDDE